MGDQLVDTLKASFGAAGYIYAIPAEDAEALPVEGYRIDLEGKFYASVAEEVNRAGWDLLYVPQ